MKEKERERRGQLMKRILLFILQILGYVSIATGIIMTIFILSALIGLL